MGKDTEDEDEDEILLENQINGFNMNHEVGERGRQICFGACMHACDLWMKIGFNL